MLEFSDQPGRVPTVSRQQFGGLAMLVAQERIEEEKLGYEIPTTLCCSRDRRIDDRLRVSGADPNWVGPSG